MRINLTATTINLLEQIKETLAHNRYNTDELFNRIFKTALEDLNNRKYKLKSLPPAPVSPSVVRYIPASIKRAVFERDKGRCTNCKSKFKLEYDHIKPFSLGGETSVKNLRLRCFSCNQRGRIQASLDGV